LTIRDMGDWHRGASLASLRINFVFRSDYAFQLRQCSVGTVQVNYIKSFGLGGGYVWALKDDDPNGDLTKGLATDLNP